MGKDQSFQSYLDQLSEEQRNKYLLSEDGYVFGGWYADQFCTVAYDLTAPVTEDLQLFAKWTKAAPDYSGACLLYTSRCV